MQNNVLRAVINARLPARDGWWQITLEHGLIAAITPQPALRAAQPDELDAQQGLVVPPFVEPHIHLDTTQTAGQPAWNQSGTLFEGIERWAERKAQLTHDDVKQRAWQTLKWQIANGIQYVRSHVDVSDPSLTALKAMLEVRQEVAPGSICNWSPFRRRGSLLSKRRGSAGGGAATGRRCGGGHSSF